MLFSQVTIFCCKTTNNREAETTHNIYIYIYAVHNSAARVLKLTPVEACQIYPVLSLLAGLTANRPTQCSGFPIEGWLCSTLGESGARDLRIVFSTLRHTERAPPASLPSARSTDT